MSAPLADLSDGMPAWTLPPERAQQQRLRHRRVWHARLHSGCSSGVVAQVAVRAEGAPHEGEAAPRRSTRHCSSLVAFQTCHRGLSCRGGVHAASRSSSLPSGWHRRVATRDACPAGVPWPASKGWQTRCCLCLWGPSGDKAAAISRKQSAITGSSLKQSYLLYRRALGYCVIVSA